MTKTHSTLDIESIKSIGAAVAAHPPRASYNQIHGEGRNGRRCWDPSKLRFADWWVRAVLWRLGHRVDGLADAATTCTATEGLGQPWASA